MKMFKWRNTKFVYVDTVVLFDSVYVLGYQIGNGKVVQFGIHTVEFVDTLEEMEREDE